MLFLQGYHLNLTFPLGDYDSQYLSSPGGYVSSLLGQKGPGSILSYLKTKNLAHHLTASHKQFHKARFSLMLVSIQLTDHGERHVDSIVKVREKNKIVLFISLFSAWVLLPPT